MPALPLLLLCLPLFLAPSAAADPATADRAALLGIKRSVADDPLHLLSGWSPAAGSHCRWRGVTCDGVSGRVTALDLAGGGPSGELAGTLAGSVGDLAELRVLSLRGNAFHGEIPGEAFGGLRLLEVLDLRQNNFSGRIPLQISTLASLRILQLSYNSLAGDVPGDLMGHSTLEVLDLSHNQLSGKVVASPPGSCPALTTLWLSDNFLVDGIPAEIGNCTNLRSVLLDGNILEGRIPAEIGRLSELRVLDVSRNSLTDRIPKEIGSCKKLSVLILTNPVDGSSPLSEFNAFVGSMPSQVLLLPTLTILWAPRANLDGRLPINWGDPCGLRILNLGQNYLAGPIPEQLGMCRNLSFLDLSSNELQGSFPGRIQPGCMAYLNVSHNSLDGLLPGYGTPGCSINMNIDDEDGGLSLEENLEIIYSRKFLRTTRRSNPFGPFSDDDFVVLHDFSFNRFNGSLPSSFLLSADQKPSFGLFLNNNNFTGSLSAALFVVCKDLQSFQVNFSSNQVSGNISPSVLSACVQLKRLEAAFNQLSGPIPSVLGDFVVLSHLDLRGNHLNGLVPQQLGKLILVEQLLLSENGFTGEIPWQLGQMNSLTVLDLSKNALNGSIPPDLASAPNLQILLLDHNHLSGSIPTSFSSRLTTLDVSFNNLSGHIPQLQHSVDCNSFRGNPFLQPCPDPDAISLSGQPSQFHAQELGQKNGRLKSYVIALVASASAVVSFLIVLVLFVAFAGERTDRLSSSREKVIATFADAPIELNYENVLKATGNFSLQNLIGMGGFGSTYKAELVPGFVVAVKRLSVGRFQGLQQFDAEIRTLGRIRHKNLVTLLGYHMGEVDTFLVYNYLSGGNLEAFIHNRSSKNARWPVIHKIALDVAQALAYLHYSCVPRIVHRDIKPSNILLDEKLNAYLSDFGLARLLEVSETHATTDVAGTFGYVAPEYATTCRVSDKADVYSFGVVLLELMSGKRSLDPSFSEYGDGFNIVAWGKLMIKEGRQSELFFPALWESGPKDNLTGMLRLASACTAESLAIRPSMKQVVDKLKKLKNY
uniref:non-specific serine/threonine protein kinase n=1 Tax=Anthurium amnicola TaxID=1678845 RepID=A0A1D1ZM56_9ARAE